jgi:adenylate cyclase
VPVRGAKIPEDEVRAALQRILASPAFSHAERLGTFLSYVVDEALAGRADRIKAYSVATEAFKRNPSFDPQSDPMVRIEAARLRQALERYYLVEGVDDPIIIEVPKGHYAPSFTRRPPEHAEPAEAADAVVRAAPGADPSADLQRKPRPILFAAAAVLICVTLAAVLLVASRRSAQTSLDSAVTTAGQLSGRSAPLVAVVPFADLGEAPNSSLYAGGLTEEILTNLARFPGLTVLGRDTSHSIGSLPDLARLRTQYGATYAVEGAVRTAGKNLRVSARLIDTGTGAILWSSIYDEGTEMRDALTIQKDVAERVATTLGQPRGVIFRADEKHRRTPVDPEAYACISQYYAYRAARTADRHTAVHECMERTVQRLPDYPTAWALLGLLYLDEYRNNIHVTHDRPATLDLAGNAARRALALDPDEPRAYQALMLWHWFRREHAQALEVGALGLRLNPHDVGLLREFGTRVGLSGDWVRGAALVERARALNAAQAGFYNGSLAWAAYMRGEYQVAADLIRQTDPTYPLYHFISAIIYAQVGLDAEAQRERIAFTRQRPDITENWRTAWADRLAQAKDRAHLDEGARKAGFKIPD